MPSITVRDVPEATRAALASRAARSGRSMQEYLRLHLIEIAEHPDQGELLDRVRDRVRHTGSTLSVEQILEAKDADRR